MSVVATAHGSVLALLDAVRVERAALRKAEALHARDHAPGFNIVEVFAPGETSLSSLFRWLLDDRASHGQGAAFRDLFFATVPQARVAGADWRGATVRCEVPTRDGRIDLLLESADARSALAVENKPWAGWQARQLERYRLDQLPYRAPGGVRVLALIGGCDDAQAYVEAHWRADPKASEFPGGEVFGIGFDLVAEWVDRCAATARPVKLMAFLRDLAVYFRTKVARGATMNDDAVATAIIDGGPERINAALEVSVALPAVLRRSATMLLEQLRATNGFDDRWSAASATVDGSKFHGLTLKAADGLTLSYALFDVNRGAPWVGLIATAEQAGSYDLAALERGRDGRWVKWEYLDDISLPGITDIYRGVIDGSFAPRLLAHAGALAAALRRPMG